MVAIPKECKRLAEVDFSITDVSISLVGTAIISIESVQI